MEENLNAIVNLDDDERCLKTLYISYKQLPVHLKPCFLYMGFYREDYVICISNLIKLWVVEGILKPISGKRQEDVARAYIKELSERNLILIHKLGSLGSIKECKVHDLFRDVCLREAKKEGFYIIGPGHEIENGVSRIVMSGKIPEFEKIDALSSAHLARSLILNLHDQRLPPRHIMRLLRIVGSDIASGKFIDNVHQLVNLRFFFFTVEDEKFPSLICMFWNLQTLTISRLKFKNFIVPSDIWYMSHIRHLDIDDLYLPDPPPNVEDGIVLENLQTLGIVKDFTCSEQLVKRIPNITKLKLSYGKGVDDRFRLTNLDSLDKLESLNCNFNRLKCQINYPQSLKKLTLTFNTSICLQDILDKIGALPLLQKLKLFMGSFKEGEWETTEGQFRSLKFLSLHWCKGLQVWTTEASHFPRLEQLHLSGLDDLVEISLDFADMSTLRLIEVEWCCDSAVESAKRILEEQEALYGEEETTLQIQVKLGIDNNPVLASLRSPNFHVR